MGPANWARQELSRWRTSPSRLLLALSPLVVTAFCLSVYQARVVRDLPVAVVDQDHSGISRALIRDMDASPQMEVVQVPDAEQAMDGFRRGSWRAVVLVPQGMDRETRAGRSSELVVWRDATNPMAANQIYSAMATIVATENGRLVAGRLAVAGLPLSQAKEMAMPLRADPRAITNPSFDYLSNFAPGLFPVFLQMALMLAAGTMLPAGWKGSSRPLAELAGRSIPWIALQILSTLVYFSWIAPLLGAPAASPAGTVALATLLSLASLATGAVFGRLVQSPVKATQFLLAFNTPAFPLSGYTFPEWAMPPLLSKLASPLPFSLYIDAYRGMAGWSTDRPILAWLGLLGWLVIPLAILAIPGKGGGQETETVNRPDPVSGGWGHALVREFRRLTRTPGLSTIFLAAPLLYLCLYGSMYMDKEERRIPLAMVSEGGSKLARELSTNLSAHPQIRLLPMTRQEARQALSRNAVRGVLEVPDDLDIRMRRREATAIPLLFVADRFLPANDLQRSVGEVLTSMGTRERLLFLESKGLPPAIAKDRACALVMDDRPLGNPHETYGDFMLPILGILIMHQLCLVGSAFAAAASAGAHRARDFAARTALFTGWFGLWLFLWVAVAMPLLSVPLSPHLPGLIALSLVGMVAVSLLGSLLGMIAGDPQMATQLLAFTSYPFFFASGASWPREMFPGWVDFLANAIPLAPWITAGNRAMRLGAGLPEIAGEIAHLGILACALAAGLWIVCRFQPGRAKREIGPTRPLDS
ncbi:MAG TPA: ABC transporter permease [Fibrobacteria bacterium]|nr:ABC transporter permease [Fibrobacteria bacterium]